MIHLTTSQFEVLITTPTGGFAGFLQHVGRIPSSLKEFNEHFKNCTFCQRKEREYQESSS